MTGGGGADVPKTVCAWGGDGDTRLLYKGLSDLMPWVADTDKACVGGNQLTYTRKKKREYMRKTRMRSAQRTLNTQWGPNTRAHAKLTLTTKTTYTRTTQTYMHNTREYAHTRRVDARGIRTPAPASVRTRAQILFHAGALHTHTHTHTHHTRAQNIQNTRAEAYHWYFA